MYEKNHLMLASTLFEGFFEMYFALLKLQWKLQLKTV